MCHKITTFCYILQTNGMVLLYLMVDDGVKRFHEGKV